MVRRALDPLAGLAARTDPPYCWRGPAKRRARRRCPPRGGQHRDHRGGADGACWRAGTRPTRGGGAGGDEGEPGRAGAVAGLPAAADAAGRVVVEWTGPVEVDADGLGRVKGPLPRRTGRGVAAGGAGGRAADGGGPVRGGGRGGHPGAAAGPGEGGVAGGVAPGGAGRRVAVVVVRPGRRLAGERPVQAAGRSAPAAAGVVRASVMIKPGRSAKCIRPGGAGEGSLGDGPIPCCSHIDFKLLRLTQEDDSPYFQSWTTGSSQSTRAVARPVVPLVVGRISAIVPPAFGAAFGRYLTRSPTFSTDTLPLTRSEPNDPTRQRGRMGSDETQYANMRPWSAAPPDSACLYSSLSLSVCPTRSFHSTQPFADLPSTTPAAADGLEKR